MHHWHFHVLAHIRLVLVSLILLMPAAAQLFTPVRAIPQVQTRFDRVADSVPGVNTTHLIGFTYTDLASPVGSVSIEFCTNSPLPDIACVAPTDMDVLASTFAAQTGETGFTVNATETTANRIVLTRPPALPQATTAESTYQFDDVLNPTPEGTHFGRIQTFASTDATGAALEDGGVAFSINQPFTVSAEVPPYIRFCSSVTIIGYDCSTANSFFIDFGDFDVFTSKFASSEMVIATNAGFGYSVTLSGTTLTSGNNVIPALSAQSASSPGISQFGLNLRNNSAPNIGANPTGPGTAQPAPEYNAPNQFRFNEGDVIISGSGVTDSRKFTASYITNVSTNQEPGIYATTISFIAVANF